MIPSRLAIASRLERLSVPLALLVGLALAAAPAAVAVSPDAATGAAQAAQADDPYDEEAGDDLGEEPNDELDGEPWNEEDMGGDLDDDELDQGPDPEVAALERATADLARAKRAAAGELARLSRRSASLLHPCASGGPGWKRIRSIDHAPQRALYTAAARRLLADMRLLLDVQQPRIAAYGPAYRRFVTSLEQAPVADPLLSAAVSAQARRVASYRDVAAVKASCRVFNRLTRRVRGFPTRSAAQIVRADYRAAPIARRIERHVSDQLRRIDRRHGIAHRDVETLADAAALMVDLGGDPGSATGFQYALSLR